MNTIFQTSHFVHAYQMLKKKYVASVSVGTVELFRDAATVG